MNKEQIFKRLKEKGLIPAWVELEHIPDNTFKELEAKLNELENPVLDRNKELTMKEFEPMIYNAVASAMKSLGIGSTEIKHEKFPGVELTDQEKALPDKERKNLLFKKFVKNVINTKSFNSELSGEAGGYLVPTEYRNEIIMLMKDYGIFRKYATEVSMTRKEIEIPSLVTKPTGGFVTEGQAKQVSNLVFGQKKLSRNEWAFITAVTNQLLEDEAYDLAGTIAKCTAEDFAYGEDYHGFKGTGSPIDGLAHVSGVNEIYPNNAKVTFATALSLKLLVDMITAVPSTVLKGSRWFMHPTILGLVMQLKDSGERPIFADVLSRGIDFGNILGFPYSLSDVLPSTNDETQTNIPFIYFGNLQYAYLGNRNSMSALISNIATVDNVSAYQYNLTYFRMEQSYDIEIMLPNAFAKGRTD